MFAESLNGPMGFYFAVWQQLMVPVLNIRALASYGVLYLDSLFRY